MRLPNRSQRGALCRSVSSRAVPPAFPLLSQPQLVAQRFSSPIEKCQKARSSKDPRPSLLSHSETISNKTVCPSTIYSHCFISHSFTCPAQKPLTVTQSRLKMIFSCDSEPFLGITLLEYYYYRSMKLSIRPYFLSSVSYLHRATLLSGNEGTIITIINAERFGINNPTRLTR